MSKFIGIFGNIVAVLGILTCIVAGATRLSARYYVAGFEAMVVFTLGIGLMVFVCLIKLYLLESKT